MMGSSSSSTEAQDEPIPVGDVTHLLGCLGGPNDHEIYDRLLPLILDELRDLANGLLEREGSSHTLQPTALVNEAYLRLVAQRQTRWESRGHFLAIAATAMRRILVDHARRRIRRRRDLTRGHELLETTPLATHARDEDLLALDAAMKKLSQIDGRKVQVVELRFFVGLDVQQTAEALGISAPTVKREWRFARVWLKRELEAGE